MKIILRPYFILILAIIILLLNKSNSTALIQPLSHKHLELEWNHITSNLIVQAKFTLEVSSINSLYYNHVFGLTLPKNSFDFSGPDQTHSCELKIGNLVVTSRNLYNNDPSTLNTIFCSIDSKESSGLKLLKESIITLVVKIFKTPKTKLINNIGIFYATTYLNDRIILASNPVFGSIYLYPNFIENSNYNILKIDTAKLSTESPSLNCYKPPCSLIYPYSKLSLTLQISSNGFFQTSTNDILMIEIIKSENTKWSKTMPNNTPTIINLSYTNLLNQEIQDNQKELTTYSSLRLIPFKNNLDKDESNYSNKTYDDLAAISNRFIVDGIDENISVGRKFSFVILGLESSIPSDSVIKLIKIYVLRKNSNSVLSYHEYNYSILHAEDKVEIANIAKPDFVTWSGISHPEFFNIYENASWPLKFLFTLPALPNGGMVDIIHNTDNSKIFNFITSTCDFSDELNTSLNNDSSEDNISNEIGKRPVCFPKSKNKNLEFIEGEEGVNSGFNFFVSPSTSSRTISVTIWGVALKCSSHDYNNDLNENTYNYNIQSTLNNSERGKKLSFSISVLAVENPNVVIAKNENISMLGICFSNIIQSKYNSYSDFNTKSIIDNRQIINETKDVLLFKEVYDWNLIKGDFTDFSGDYEIKSIINSGTLTNSNSNQNNDTNNNSLSFIAESTNFPLPYYRRSSGTYTNYKGYLSLQLSSSYLSYPSATLNLLNSSTSNNNINDAVDKSNCSLSWISNTNSKTTVTKLKDETNTLSRKKYQMLNNSNFYLPGRKNDNSIDNTTIFKYYEPVMLNSPLLNYSSNLIFLTNPNTVEYVGFNTNCFVISNKDKFKIKSLYSYIDFTYIFNKELSSDNYAQSRVSRFIKMFPSNQVFNESYISGDTNNNNLINADLSNNINYYYTFKDDSNSKFYCLLTISNLELGVLGNTLVLNFINTRLPDVDTFDMTSTYPVAYEILDSDGIVKETSQLTSQSSLKAYLNNSIYPFSSEAWNSSLSSQLDYSSNEIITPETEDSNAVLSVWNRNSVIKNIIFNYLDNENLSTKGYFSDKTYYSVLGSTITITNLPSSLSSTPNSNTGESRKMNLAIPINCPYSFVDENTSHIYQSLTLFTFDYNTSLNEIISKSTALKVSSSTSSNEIIHQLTTSTNLINNKYNNLFGFKFNNYISDSQEQGIIDNERLYMKGFSEEELSVKCNTILFMSNGIKYSNNANSEGNNIYMNSNNGASENAISKVLIYRSNQFIFDGHYYDQISIFLPTTNRIFTENAYVNGVIRPTNNEFLKYQYLVDNNMLKEKQVSNIDFICFDTSEKEKGESGDLYSSTSKLHEMVESPEVLVNKIVNDEEVNIFDIEANLNGTGQVYFNDSAISIVFKVTIISKLTRLNGVLSIFSDSIKQYSRCLIKDNHEEVKNAVLNISNNSNTEINNSYNKECSVVAGSIVCNQLHTNDNTTSFEIFCYNLKLNENKLTILNNTSFNNGYVNTTLLSNRVKMFGTLNEDGTSNLPSTSAVIQKIVNVEFSQTVQIGSLGILYLRVDLIRPVVINQVIRVTLNSFSDFLTSESNCFATFTSSTDYSNIKFGDQYRNGDGILERCIIEKSTTNNKNVTITIVNNNNILFTTDGFSRFLLIRLSPIIQIDLKEKTYLIDSSVENFISDENFLSAKSTSSQLFPIYTFNKSNTVNYKKDGTLCSLVNITPAIIGSFNQLIFEIDLTDFPVITNTDANETTSTANAINGNSINFSSYEVNEVTIFLSKNKFSALSYNNLNTNNGDNNLIDIHCEYKGESALCLWNEEGFLNFRPRSKLEKNKSHLITLTGIKISPDVFSSNINIINTSSNNNNTKHVFNCSVNYIKIGDNFTRENLIVGTGSVNLHLSDFINAEKNEIIVPTENDNNSTNINNSNKDINDYSSNLITNVENSSNSGGFIFIKDKSFYLLPSDNSIYNSRDLVRTTTDLRLCFTFDDTGDSSNKYSDSSLTKQFDSSILKLTTNNTNNSTTDDNNASMLFIIELPSSYNLKVLKNDTVKSIKIRLNYTVIKKIPEPNTTNIPEIDFGTKYNYSENTILEPFSREEMLLFTPNTSRKLSIEYRESKDINISKVEIKNNSILVYLQEKIINLDHYFTWFNLEIDNLPTPDNYSENYFLNTNLSESINGYRLINVSEFNIAFLNNHLNPKTKYSTFTNTNNFILNPAKSNLNSYDWYRGFTFSHEDADIAMIDFYSELESPFNGKLPSRKEFSLGFNEFRNSIKFFAGRYNKIRVEVTPRNASASSFVYFDSSQNSSQLSKDIKIIEDKVLVNTGLDTINYINIGVNCEKYKFSYGSEFIKFSLTSQSNFSNLPLIRVSFVKTTNKNKEKIILSSLFNPTADKSYDKSEFSLSPEGSFTRMFFSYSSIPVDILSFEFNVPNGKSNHSSFKIRSANINNSNSSLKVSSSVTTFTILPDTDYNEVNNRESNKSYYSVFSELQDNQEFNSFNSSNNKQFIEFTITQNSSDKDKITEAQSLQIKSLNACYNFANNEDTRILTFSVNDEIAKISKVNLASKFKYVPTNNIYNSNLIDNELSTIKLQFYDVIPNTHLYCSLVCFEMDFPSMQLMTELPFKSNPYHPGLVKFYYNHFSKSSNSNNIELKFSNLQRSTKYKLKCLLANNGVGNNSEAIQVTYSNNFTNISLTDTNVNTNSTYSKGVALLTATNTPITYFKLEFDNRQSELFYNRLLFNLQNLVDEKFGLGSIVLTDSVRKYPEIGYYLSKKKDCRYEKSYSEILYPYGVDNITTNNLTNSTNNNITNSTNNNSTNSTIQQTERIKFESQTKNEIHKLRLLRQLQTSTVNSNTDDKSSSEVIEYTQLNGTEVVSSPQVNITDTYLKPANSSYIMLAHQSPYLNKNLTNQEIAAFIQGLIGNNNLITSFVKNSNGETLFKGNVTVTNFLENEASLNQLIMFSYSYVDQYYINFIYSAPSDAICYWKLIVNDNNSNNNNSSSINHTREDIQDCIMKNQGKGKSNYQLNLFNRCGMVNLINTKNLNNSLEMVGSEISEQINNSNLTNTTDNNSTNNNSSLNYTFYKNASLDVGKLDKGKYKISFVCNENLPFAEKEVSIVSSEIEITEELRRVAFKNTDVPKLISVPVENNEVLKNACTNLNNFCLANSLWFYLNKLVLITSLTFLLLF